MMSSVLAEREGFEPPIRLPVCRISSAVHSTTLPPLHSIVIYHEIDHGPAKSGRRVGIAAIAAMYARGKISAAYSTPGNGVESRLSQHCPNRGVGQRQLMQVRPSSPGWYGTGPQTRVFASRRSVS